MESSNIMAMKCSLIVCLFLSSLSVANSFVDEGSPFDRCYGFCFVVCVGKDKIPFYKCPLKCLKTCMSKPSEINTSLLGLEDNYTSCELDCATSSCTKFSTKEDPASKEVGRCVDSCSQTCFKN